MAIHFHNSDFRFCGSRQSHRQFTMADNEVTCGKCRERVIVAMVTKSGTACAETALRGDEDTPAMRASLEKQFCLGRESDPVAGSWTDCSENEALAA